MTKLSWGLLGDRSYESGVDQGVFYPKNSPAVPWSGLISVDQTTPDNEIVAYYIEGTRYFNQMTEGPFTAALVAYSYPSDVEEGIFDLCYRTLVDGGYKIHLVYNINAEPQAMDFLSLTDAAAAMNFGWDLTTIPEKIPGLKPSAHLIIDSRVAYPDALQAIEDVLYGSDDNDPYLPSAEDVLELFNGFAVLKITDYGDGTWSAEGPDDIVYMTDSETFAIDYISAQYLDETSYTVYSL